MTWIIVLSCVAAWLLAGAAAGRRAAPIAYRRHRANYPSLAYRSVDEGQASAAGAFTSCLLAGPLGWVYVLAHSVSEQAVPELRAARAEATAKAHREEIAAMQRQIDEAHKALGIAPMKHAAS